MKKKLDNTSLWNEAAKAGVLFGVVSISCLVLKELAGMSGSAFLVQAAAIILWAVEFFGCILLMKKVQLDLRDKYEGILIGDCFRLGRRAALLSGLLLASAQALIILYMEGIVDRLPVFTFLFQWLYCFLYGTVLSSIMSRYIFLQKLFGGGFNQPEDQDSPDEQ